MGLSLARGGSCACPALAQEAYVVGLTGALTGPAGRDLRARRRGAAPLYRGRQCRRRRQRQQGQPDPAGRLGRAFEGRRQRQEAAHPGQRACC